jgi:hypothetical protein
MILLYALAAHFIGDYLLQTDYMAQEKLKRWSPAILHGITYTIPFAFLTQSPLALLVIGGTHIVIDRYRLAKYLNWFKNQFAPKAFRPPMTATGYGPDKPDWMAVWLLIISDNIIHILINAAALTWLT